MVGIWAASFILGELIRSARKAPDRDRERFDRPTAAEGAPVPVVFGTVMVAPNVIWFGDERIEPRTQKTSTGLFSSDTQTVGYTYYAGMQLAVCHGPVDAIDDVLFGEHALSRRTTFGPSGIATPGPDLSSPLVPIPYAAAGTLVEVTAPKLFGGDDGGGGIAGDMCVYFGSDSQPADSYLVAEQTVIGTAAGAFSGLCHLVLRGMNLGTSPSPPAVQVIVRRCPQPLASLLGAYYSDLGEDANPAEVLYETLTDERWGLAIPASEIDAASFHAAAVEFGAGGPGISCALTDQQSGAEFVREVLRHIDGVIFMHPRTGLLTLYLVRPGYIVADLPRFHRGNLDQFQFSRGSWAEVANEIKVTFTSREARYKTGAAQEQNLAAIQAKGQTVSETVDYPFLMLPHYAQRAALRDLRVRSGPLAKCSFVGDRSAAALTVGAPFVVEKPEDAIGEIVMRVVRIDYGSLDEPGVAVDAVEDVFDTSGTAQAAPPPPLVPTVPPEAAWAQVLFEAPYVLVGARRHVYMAMTPASYQQAAWELWAAEGAAPMSLRATTALWTHVAWRGVNVAPPPYPAATAAVDEVGFDVLATPGFRNVQAPVLAMMDGELISIGEIVHQPFYSTLRKITRGLFDTVPIDHPVESFATGEGLIWFIGAGGVAQTATDAYATDVTVSAAPLPRTRTGLLALADAAVSSLTTTGRALQPYPPGNVRLNGLGYEAWPAAVTGTAVLTWSHRSRLAQGAALVAQDAGDTGTPEGTYTVEVLIAGNVVRTWANLAGTTQSYTLAERSADDPDLTKPVAFRITPVATLTGRARTTPSFLMQA